MIEQFHAPGTVREALQLKGKLKGRAVFLAGGTWLNSTDCPLRPEQVISLAALGLDRIAKTEREVTIGALCTLQRLIDDRKVPAPLKAAALQVKNRNIRNMATIGGHIAGNRPDSDLIPMLVALDAKVLLAGGGGAGSATAAKRTGPARPGSAASARTAPGAARRIPIEAFIQSPPPGLITGIALPLPDRNRVAACRNVRASANARSLLSAAASMTVSRSGIADPIIALGGSGRPVARLTAVEEALNGKPLPTVDEIQALVAGAGRARGAHAGVARARGGQAASRVRASRGAPPSGGGAHSASPAFLDYQAAALVALLLHDALRQKGGRS